nr:hypothetical protein BaRGS_018242 [Batillaria attramentaria]
MQTPRDPNADVTKTLRRVIHKNLDTMLYGAPRKTKLRNVEDEEELVHKVAEMTELLESDLTTCFTSAQQYSHHDENTYGKSMPVVIQGAMQQLVTDHEILQQEHEQLQQEKEDAERSNLQSRHKTEAMQESTFQLELEHQKLTEDKQKLKEHVSSLETEEKTLRLTLQDLEQENSRLQKQVENLEENNTHLAKGLDKSQHTCAHLTVQVADQAKEIARLKDPDPEMVYRIQTLQSELTESKTANRKLELEKGAIKSNLQKLQASYNAMLKERGILSKENIQLHKENELVKTTNKKLVLASQILR